MKREFEVTVTTETTEEYYDAEYKLITVVAHFTTDTLDKAESMAYDVWRPHRNNGKIEITVRENGAD